MDRLVRYRTMQKTIPRLKQLQQRMEQRAHSSLLDAVIEKLYFMEVQGLLHVEFYGSPFEEAFTEFLEILCEPDVAASIRSLIFRGPDEGANGTRTWDFTQLLDSTVSFPNLTSCSIEPTAPGDHNETIIAQMYDEEGQIARLLAKMPAIEYLTVPSAPDASFFTIGGRPLAILRVDSGYDHQDFILNLSRSSGFPALRALDFGDYNQTYIEDYRSLVTPFEHYQQLFRSQAFASVGTFVLRNAILSAEQHAELRALNQKVQFLIIQTESQYVR